jgi:ribosome maturation factor RimP
MGATDRVRDLAAPVCDALEVGLVDVELAGGVLRVTVDRDGDLDLDLDIIARLTRQISRLLDEDDPVPGRYTLEVSSPGLERKLRTPAHFERVVGQVVNVRTHAGTGAGRRFRGTLVAADAEGITVRTDEVPDGTAEADAAIHTLRYDQIERARTVFEWGPGPKPGSPSSKSRPPNPKKAAKP